MKKFGLLIALLMILTVAAAGCGKTEKSAVQTDTAVEDVQESSNEDSIEKSSGDASSSVDLSAVKAAIISGAGVTDPIDVASDRLVNLYGIEESQIKQAAAFITIGAVFPDEIVMIEAVDDAAAAQIEAALSNRLAEVKEQSKSYDPESYALALECTVDKNGLFVSMFLAPGHAKMKSIYGEYVS